MEELNLYAHNSSMYSMTPHNNQIMCFYRKFLINLQISTSSTQSLPWSSSPLGWRNKTDSHGQTRPAGGRWPDWGGRVGGSGGGRDGVPVVAGPAPDARHGRQIAAPPPASGGPQPRSPAPGSHRQESVLRVRGWRWGGRVRTRAGGRRPGPQGTREGGEAPSRRRRREQGAGEEGRCRASQPQRSPRLSTVRRAWPAVGRHPSSARVGAAQPGPGSTAHPEGWRQHPNRRGRGCAHKRLHKCVNKTRIEAQCNTFNKT